MWVLRTEVETYREQRELLTSDPSLQPLIFLITGIMHAIIPGIYKDSMSSILDPLFEFSLL